MRGKLGGSILSANKSGNFITNNKTPIQPRTEKQTNQRSIFAQMASAWADLTSGQKTGFDTYAALPAQELTDSMGETYYASGFNWFVKLNTRLERMGRSLISVAPAGARPTAPSIISLVITPSGTGTNTAPGGTTAALATHPGSDPDWAYDGSVYTYWRGTAATLPNWVSTEAAAAHLVAQIVIKTGAHSGGYAPTEFKFQGWDGATWDDLLSLAGQPSWANNEERSYSFSNKTLYEDYRLYTIATTAGDHVVIWECEFYDGTVSNSRVYYPLDNFSGYDIVIFISMRNSDGSSVAYSGFKEILVSQSPGALTTGFQDELDAAFGSPIEGRKWFAEVHRQDSDGQRSAAYTIDALTV